MPTIQEIILLFPALVIGITIHEAAHAWTAYKLGDPTPKLEGRVSLNPLRHLDPLGTLFIFIIRFGWGKPVHFNPNNLKHPLRDEVLIAAAGPLSNILLVLILIPIKESLSNPLLAAWVEMTIFINLVLCLFNLIPIAPLDGSKIIKIIIPKTLQYSYNQFLEKGPVILISLLIFDRIYLLVSGNSLLGYVLFNGIEVMYNSLRLLLGYTI